MSTRSNDARVSSASRAADACVFVSLLVAALGGVYFGLFSCGGFAWHKPAFFAVLVSMCAYAALRPSTLLPSTRSRAGFVVCVPAVYIILASASSAFYPSAPRSLDKFTALFLNALLLGACG
jgi:hypothetical protein